VVVKPKLPADVVAALSAPVRVGETAQAFPFLTVADSGAPHCCLLSSTELAVAADAAVVLAAVAGRRTPAHLLARGSATLLVVSGTALHSCRLALATSITHDGVFAAALDVVDHEADSLGIPLQPLGFVPPSDLAVRERWDVTAGALAALRSKEPRWS
jgi:hypothetical protein